MSLDKMIEQEMLSLDRRFDRPVLLAVVTRLEGGFATSFEQHDFRPTELEAVARDILFSIAEKLRADLLAGGACPSCLRQADRITAALDHLLQPDASTGGTTH